MDDATAMFYFSRLLKGVQNLTSDEKEFLRIHEQEMEATLNRAQAQLNKITDKKS